jgi:hypothetical protein
MVGWKVPGQSAAVAGIKYRRHRTLAARRHRS